MKKQWISVKCGLSRDPKHRQAMGEGIWLFLHILDIASWDDGIAHDWKDEAAAEDMGMPVRTLREHRRKLDELGYITCLQKQYTQDIVIHNWTNPREYTGQTYNPKQGDSETEPEEKPQGYTQGYTQGSTKDVTPTSYSKNQIPAANAAKPDLLDAEIHFNLKPTSIREAIKTHFRLNVNWDTKLARQWMEWAVGENVTAEQIEAAAQLWRSDKAFNWQVPTLKGIFEKWPMLNTSVKLPQPKTYDPAAEVEPEYVPAPPRKK